MKGKREHRVPLTVRMIELLKALPREGGLVFIGSRANAPLGKTAMPDLVKAMGYKTTIHGFRASFKTWASETSSFARELVEVALAQSSATKPKAYQRSDVGEAPR
jgi:integrase